MEATVRPQIAYTTSNRIDSLDSIRGLAALAVLLGHTAGAFVLPTAWTRLPIVNIFFDGRSAVTMFFVLSGFVLSRPYLSAAVIGQAPRVLCLRTFYLRRITRIYIPWLIIFGLSALAQITVFRQYATVPAQSEWLQGFWNLPQSFSSVLRQFGFLLHNPAQMLLPQDWSLGVELKGSALVPLFLLLVRRHVLSLLAVGCLILVGVNTGQYYVSFILGVILSRYHGAIESKLRLWTTASKVSVLMIGILLYQSRLLASNFGPVSDRIDKLVWCLASVGCLLILTISLGSNRVQRMLSRRSFVFLGRISYSLYLVQFIVLLCLLPPTVRLLNTLGLRQEAVLMPVILCCSVLTTAALAALSYRWVEVPSMSLGRMLTRRIQSQQHSSGLIEPRVND